MFLVAFTIVNLILYRFGFFNLLLNRDQPASTISGIFDLERMLLAMGFEEEFIGAFLGHNRSITLKTSELGTRLEKFSKHTRLMIPIGDDLSSTRLA